MDEELRLLPEGALDVARWVGAAYRAGHFDWNLLCGGNDEENIAERWRMVHWLSEEKLLDDPLSETDLEGADDKETCAAIMLTFAFEGIRKKAVDFDITPEEVMAA